MDGQHVLGVDGAALVDGLADDVHDAAESLATDGNLDRLAGVPHLLSSHEALGGVHSDGTDGVLSQVLRDLENETDLVVLDLKSGQNWGQVAGRELDVDDGTDNLGGGGGRGVNTRKEKLP